MGCLFQPRAQAGFVRQDVRGPSRQNGHRHHGADHAAGGFIERAITPQDKHQIRPFGDGRPRDFGGMSRTLRRREPGFDVRTPERVDGTLKNALRIRPEPASGWVIDEYRPLMGCDFLSITRVP